MKTFVADFETTVNMDKTEVWGFALVEIGTETVEIGTSIEEFFLSIYNYLRTENVVVYFHNLKFDGSFILDYWMKHPKLKHGVIKTEVPSMIDRQHLQNKQYTYLISAMGVWYTMTLKLFNHFLDIRDSFKLLPFSVANISKSFATKHKKLTIDYKGHEHANEPLTAEEMNYIRNDVLVVKEVLEMMITRGHTKTTIGSCCMQEYKTIFRNNSAYSFNEQFPDLTKYDLDEIQFGSENADAYIRKSYKGGWCYLVKGKENRVYKNGCCMDVNSLYPSMMHSESGNCYPVGYPRFWSGDYIPDIACDGKHYYFVRVKTRFEIKPDKLPTIQIKHTLSYAENEYLESSAYIDRNGKKYHKYPFADEIIDTAQVITFTMTDWKLVQDQYYLFDTEILDGCYFETVSGLFDMYINKYREIKMNAKGAERTLAKLFLNNLYGQYGKSSDSSYKVAYLEDDKIHFQTVEENKKKVGYIPIGSAVTSYARNFTIRVAQANYHGKNKPGFIYGDTDSIHCDLEPEGIINVVVHPTNFNCWSLENTWKTAIFVRQKTYIEQTENGYEITACGLGKQPKALLQRALARQDPTTLTEKQFFQNVTKLEDFKPGLTIPGNLRQRRITGGVILYEDEFKLH